MQSSTISINVQLDSQRMPTKIDWKASQSTREQTQQAKAMLLGFWDNAENSALRIDLWTKDMMIDEMTNFFFQTFMSMADTYERATHQKELVNDIKQFAQDFYKKSKQLNID
jgi:gliding motility-associated protein GldC